MSQLVSFAKHRFSLTLTLVRTSWKRTCIVLFAHKISQMITVNTSYIRHFVHWRQYTQQTFFIEISSLQICYSTLTAIWKFATLIFQDPQHRSRITLISWRNMLLLDGTVHQRLCSPSRSTQRQSMCGVWDVSWQKCWMENRCFLAKIVRRLYARYLWSPR